MNEMLNLKVGELNLSDDTTKWLKSRGVKDFRDILCMRLIDIKKSGNLSDVNRKELISFVHQEGFRFIGDEKDSNLAINQLYVGDLHIPLNMIKALIRQNFIKVEDVKSASYEELIALPGINVKNIQILMDRINQVDIVKKEPSLEEQEYERLLKKKMNVTKRINSAMRTVERLEQENLELNELINQAKERLKHVKVKK